MPPASSSPGRASLQDGSNSVSSLAASRARAAALASEFQVNTYTNGQPVAFPGWLPSRLATSSSCGRASPGRRRAAASSPGASRVRARPWLPSSRSTAHQRPIRPIPSVAAGASGNFVVVWHEQRPGRLTKAASSLSASRARARPSRASSRSTLIPLSQQSLSRGRGRSSTAISSSSGTATLRTATTSASSPGASRARAWRSRPSSRSTPTPMKHSNFPWWPPEPTVTSSSPGRA